MSLQNQRSSDGSTAFQAGGDIHINQGLTPQQMREIFNEVSIQIQQGVAEAKSIIEERMKEFCEATLREFAENETRANADAFRDPDFQFSLLDAQKAYARSGEKELRDELVNLLAKRSAEQGRTRTAMILNDAVSKIGNLTREEVSLLGALFIFNNIFNKSTNMYELSKFYQTLLVPFVDDFPTDGVSAEYLASNGCVSLISFAGNDCMELMKERYGGVFSRGLRYEEICEFPNEMVEDIFVNTNFDEFKFKDPTLNELSKRMFKYDVGNQIKGKISALHTSISFSVNEIRDYLRVNAPAYVSVERKWAVSQAASCHLTALGKAIAHSALTSRSGFEADLAIWVK